MTWEQFVKDVQDIMAETMGQLAAYFQPAAQAAQAICILADETSWIPPYGSRTYRKANPRRTKAGRRALKMEARRAR